MICRTRLLTFYWERLGYESYNLLRKRQDVVGGSQSDPPTEYAKTCGVKPTSRTTTEMPRDQNPMG